MSIADCPSRRSTVNFALKWSRTGFDRSNMADGSRLETDTNEASLYIFLITAPF